MFKKLLDKDYYFCLNWPVYLRPIWRFKLAEICLIINNILFLSDGYDYFIFYLYLLLPLYIDLKIFYRHLHHFDSGTRIKFLWFRFDLFTGFVINKSVQFFSIKDGVRHNFVFYRNKFLVSNFILVFPVFLLIVMMIMMVIDFFWPNFSHFVNNFIDFNLFGSINEHSEVLLKLGKFQDIPRQRMSDHLMIYSNVISAILSLSHIDIRYYLKQKRLLKNFLRNDYKLSEFLIFYFSVMFAIFGVTVITSYTLFTISYGGHRVVGKGSLLASSFNPIAPLVHMVFHSLLVMA